MITKKKINIYILRILSIVAIEPGVSYKAFTEGLKPLGLLL